jgi:CPA1 family monovalent cation:H+ antiporter
VIVVRLAYAQLLPRLPRRDKVVIGWTGMRGAVSLAAALAVPRLTDSGAPFPARDEIIFVTLLVIGVTLVLQGLTLPHLLRGVVDDADEPAPRQKALARFEAVEAALERLNELTMDSDLPPSAIERARELYTQRASQLAGECRTGVAEDDTDTAAWIRLRLDLLDAERRALREMRDRGEISTQVMREVERDLDLEATRLQSRLAAA